MRIIYYSPHPTHDIVSEVGYATHQRETILALAKLGYEVKPVVMGGTSTTNLSPLATGYKPGALKSFIKALVPRFIWTTLNNIRLLKHDKKAGSILREAIESFKPDLVYERSEYLQDSGAKAAKAYGIKYFLEVNAPFVEEMRGFEGYSLLQGLAHKREKIKLDTADKVFVVSGILGEFLIKRYVCEASKIVLSPNRINPDKLNTDKNEVNNIHKTYMLDGKQVVGFVGSIFPHHGLEILVKAFDTVAQKHTHAVLMIVGDGSVLPDVKALAASLPSHGRIIFTGKIPHEKVFGYIECMNICVMAKSNWYGSPIKIFEYGALGKPVIAPDTGPVKDVMKNGVHGLLVTMTEEEVAAAIEKLLADNALSKSVSQNFKQLILDQYTWEHAARLIIQQCA